MNKTVKTLILISVLAGFTCCTREALDNTEPDVPEGYIRAALDLQVEKPDSIQTRATETEEDAFDDSNVWVLMFNATSDSDATPTTLVQAPVKAIKSAADKFNVLLRATTQPVSLYVVAGLSSTLNTYMATASNFQEGVTDYSTVNGQLQTAAVAAGGVPIGSGSYFHMVSDRAFFSTGTTLLKTISGGLTRNVAKINVDASAVSSDFEMETVALVNAAKKGYVFPQADIPVNHGGTMQCEEKTATDNILASQIYLYENAGFLTDGTTPNPTKLIIKGKYKGGESGYYRMDILKNNGDGTYTPYDIKRNCCYTLKIGKIENGGYLTMEEAIAAEPSNTWYTVNVNDPDSYDIVSNGHYYLGVSNSEFIVYGNSGQIENLHITTVTTDAPAGTYTDIAASGDLSDVTSSFTTLTGSATVTEIYATLNANTNGHIDLRVGNLTKRITVRRGSAVAREIGEKTDFTDSDYRTGKVVSGAEWVRFAVISGADFNLSPALLTNPAGGLYVRYNSILNLDTSLPAQVFVFKTNNLGRAKMLLFTAP